MSINLSKTTCQFFTFNRCPFDHDLKIQSLALQETDVTKYLSCVLDSKLSWNRHVEYVYEKNVKRLPVLERLAGGKWGCSWDNLNTSFKFFIQSIFIYCNEIFISAAPILSRNLKLSRTKFFVLLGVLWRLFLFWQCSV